MVNVCDHKLGLPLELSQAADDWDRRAVGAGEMAMHIV